MNIFFSRIIVPILFLLILMQSTFSQSNELKSHKKDDLSPQDIEQQVSVRKSPVPLFYMHASGGAALAWLSSSDIEDLLIEDAGIGSLGGPFSWSINSGIKNIIQFEYRKGDGSHDIRQTGFVEGGGVGNTGIGTVAEVKMDYDFTDMVLKLNPFFWKTKRTGSGINYSYFLLAGTGDVEYRDKGGDGFEGTSKIYGVEITTLSRYVHASFSIKYYAIKFDEGEVFGIPFDTKLDAGHTQFLISVGFGFGI